MTKPRPIAEIVVEGIKDGTILEISVASQDAREWVTENIHQFGAVIELSNWTYDFQLVVGSLFVADEVAVYLRTQGASENDSASPTAFDTAPSSADATDGAQS